VDGTTDKHNPPYVIVYVHTIESNRSISYYYEVLELSKGESSKEMSLSLLEAFQMVHCLAHRLDLSIEWAVEKGGIPYFENVDSILSKLYTFYQSRGSKRFYHIQDTADELDIKL
jgi:hypothetical protein